MLAYSICHFNVGYYIFLFSIFTQTEHWLCSSLSPSIQRHVSVLIEKHLLCLPQRLPSPPCADVLGTSCCLYIPSPASAEERPQRSVTGPTGKPRLRFASLHICHNKQGTAGCGQRAEDERDLAVAHQEASAVAEPPAAVLSGQHEGKGLAVRKKIIVRDENSEAIIKTQTYIEARGEVLSKGIVLAAPMAAYKK